jgi:hypothetical protein
VACEWKLRWNEAEEFPECQTTHLYQCVAVEKWSRKVTLSTNEMLRPEKCLFGHVSTLHSPSVILGEANYPALHAGLILSLKEQCAI